ncbi:MAG TPA: oligosaccharide flippase family protein, partial [Bacteroidota bacterium]|nr:oligosaccharide flippase family protein [Bacteroidota bacterium]
VPVTSSVILYAAFIVPAALLLLLLGDTLGGLLRSETAGDLLWYVALMLIISIPRNVASFLLQSKLELRALFSLDAIYSLGSLAMIGWLVTDGTIATAEGVMQVNLLMLAASSVYGTVLMLKKYALRPAWSAAMLSRTWEYGRYSLGASIFYTLYSQADNLIISGIMGPVPLASYNAAKVFTRAYELFQQTINTLLVPVVSHAHGRNDTERLKVLAEKSLLFFSVAAAGVTLFFLLAGGPMMSFFYGDKYTGAVPVLAILACAGTFIPLFAVGAAFCNGVAEMRPVFYLNLLTALAGVGLMAVLTGPFGINGSAYAVLGTSALVGPMWLRVLVRRVGIPLRARDILRRSGDIMNFIKNRVPHV